MSKGVTSNCVLESMCVISSITKRLQYKLLYKPNSYTDQKLLVTDFIFAVNLDDECKIMIDDDTYNKLLNLYKLSLTFNK